MEKNFKKFSLSEKTKKLIFNQLERERIIDEAVNEMETSEKTFEFFEGYSRDSVKKFITYVAKKKADYLEFGPLCSKYEEETDLNYKKEAEECLWEIQQKKLFDLQCLWRSEKIKMDEIECSFDFKYWEFAIKKCHFLPTITPEEVEFYCEYLMSANYKKKECWVDWQAYEQFEEEKTSSPETGCFPAWYEYHNSHASAQPHVPLLLPPDVRGFKENYFHKIWWENFGQSSEEDIKDINNFDFESGEFEKPAIGTDNDVFEKFISKFWDKKILKYHEQISKWKHGFNNEKALSDALQILRDSGIQVALENDPDWRQAIIKTAIKLKKQQIAALLPIVYEEYLFRVNVNIPFDESEFEIKWQNKLARHCQNYKQRLTMAREFLG